MVWDMLKIFSSILVACLSALPLLGQTTFYFPQVGDGVAGDIRFQTSLVFVNVGLGTTIQVEFFSTPNGQPLQLTLGNLGSRSSFQIPLSAGGSVSLQTPGTAGIQVGYARVTVPAGREVGGTAVFTRTDVPTGTILYEAGVPAATALNEFSFFADTLGDRDTGLALVNVVGGAPAGNTPNMVTLRLYNRQFQQIATTDVTLNPGQHRASYVDQFFSAVPGILEMEGSVIVSSPDSLAAVTLRQNDAPGEFPDDVPTLTTFPVIPGAAATLAGIRGVFSKLSNNDLAVVLDLNLEKGPVIGAVFHLFDGERLVDQIVRGVSDQGLASLTLPVGDPHADVDRVEVELILRGGEKSPRYVLESQ